MGHSYKIPSPSKIMYTNVWNHLPHNLNMASKSKACAAIGSSDQQRRRAEAVRDSCCASLSSEHHILPDAVESRLQLEAISGSTLTTWA